MQGGSLADFGSKFRFWVEGSAKAKKCVRMVSWRNPWNPNYGKYQSNWPSGSRHVRETVTKAERDTKRINNMCSLSPEGPPQALWASKIVVISNPNRHSGSPRLGESVPEAQSGVDGIQKWPVAANTGGSRHTTLL